MGDNAVIAEVHRRLQAIIGEEEDTAGKSRGLGLVIAQKLTIEVLELGIGGRFHAGIEAQKVAIEENHEALALHVVENGFNIAAGDAVLGAVLERRIAGKIAC